MPEKLPEIMVTYAVKQHCATGMLAHFTLQHHRPGDGEDYLTLYEHINQE